jgi:hypothetical protein
MNGFELPKSLNDSLQENLAEIGRQGAINNRNLSEFQQRAAGIPPKPGARLIVYQVPSTGQATITDADKPNLKSVGFERVGAFVARDLRVEVPAHGLPVPNFEKWKQEREAEGTVFEPVSTIF